MRILPAAIAPLAALSVASGAFASPTALPDTPAGRIGREVIRHLNADTPEEIRQWAPSVLSPAFDADDKTEFVKGLAFAARDSGGVDLIEARDGRRPGNLLLTLKGRRTGQHALIVLAADTAQPDKLVRAMLVPTDDPQLYAAWPKGPVPRAEMTRLIRAALDKLARTADFSGCVTVVDGAQTLLDECRGLAERSYRVGIDKQTKFHIGSMDKMVTAVAIAQLVEAGKLSWDATLADLVPEYLDKETARKVTVWQLLHHTAGLGDFFVPEFFQKREKFVNPADYLDLIARQPKVGEPGKQWSYSNAGFILLGRIVEKASGEGYFDYVQHHVFAPAGMTSSGFDAVEDITPKLAVGYFRDGPFSTEWKANWMTLPFKASPAGGGYSTNADLLRFAEALRQGKLVKPATLQRMFEGEVPAGPGGYAAGFGDLVVSGRHVRGHSGGAPGMNADLEIVWETSAAVAVTSNEDGPAAQELAQHIATLLAGEGARSPVRPAS